MTDKIKESFSIIRRFLSKMPEGRAKEGLLRLRFIESELMHFEGMTETYRCECEIMQKGGRA
jgi:hypothetical protein